LAFGLCIDGVRLRRDEGLGGERDHGKHSRKAETRA
jgi:hypothetical protein